MSAVSCAIVGDGMVGKTCLAKKFSGLEVTENYVATIMDIFSGTASAYGEQYRINIKDTAGQVRFFFIFFFIDIDICVIFLIIFILRKLYYSLSMLKLMYII